MNADPQTSFAEFDEVLPGESPEEVKERERDCTPRLIVRQVLEAQFPDRVSVEVLTGRTLFVPGARITPEKPLLVLDWCAGAGVWASEMRRLCNRYGIPVHITAVELAACERPHLARWADNVVIDDWRNHLCMHERYDIVLGNPAFSQMHDGVRFFIARASMLIVLGLVDVFTRSKAGRAIAREYTPRREWRISGTVGFRESKGSDQRSYAVTVFEQNREPCTPNWSVCLWPAYLLPDLPASARSWSVRPGTELPSDPLVEGIPRLLLLGPEPYL